MCRLTFIVNHTVAFHISFRSRTERLFVHGTTCVALIDEFLVSHLCLLLNLSLSCDLCCLLHNILGWLIKVRHVNACNLFIRRHIPVKLSLYCLRKVTDTIIERLQVWTNIITHIIYHSLGILSKLTCAPLNMIHSHRDTNL